MGSKQKETVLEQKSYFEAKLKERRSYLAEKGIDPQKIAKDQVLKKIKSKIRKMTARLEALDKIKRKTEELEKIKAERLAAPPKQKGKKAKESEEEPETGKEKKKKKKKKTETDE